MTTKLLLPFIQVVCREIKFKLKTLLKTNIKVVLSQTLTPLILHLIKLKSRLILC